MNDKKAIASLCLCNTASMNIYDIIYGMDDYITAGINDNNPHKYKIYYADRRGSYFKIAGRRYYLNEFIRMV